MEKKKMLLLSAVLTVSTVFSATSSANLVSLDDYAIWSKASNNVGITSDLVSSMATSRSTDLSSSLPVPPAFWLLGAAMVFLFRKPHKS